MKPPSSYLGIRHSDLFVLLPAAILLVLGYLRASMDTVDDAYISFRCIDNFVRGSGLTFNPGEIVECYSNPLMIFLLIPLRALSLPLELGALLIGFLSIALASYSVFQIVRKITVDQSLAIMASAAIASFFPFLYYGMTGLETGLFGALIVAVVARIIAVEKFDAMAAVLLFALVITRPEGPAYLIALVAPLLFLEKSVRGKSFLWWGSALLGFLIFLCWRFSYYGDWMPNTFYAKPPGAADLRPGNNPVYTAMLYLLRYWQLVGFLLPIAALAAWLPNLLDFRYLAMAAMVGTGMAFGFYTGGDWFPASRYLLPITPVLAALAFVAMPMMEGWLAASPLRMAIRFVLFASVLLGSVFGLYEFQAFKDRYPYHVMNGSECAEVGIWLRDNTSPDSRIVAYRIGAVGYYSDREIIDLFGLIHKDIAKVVASSPDWHPSRQLGGDNERISNLVAGRDPDGVLAINSVGMFRPDALPLYGFHFVLKEVFPQGDDQEMLLYWRDDRQEKLISP